MLVFSVILNYVALMSCKKGFVSRNLSIENQDDRPKFRQKLYYFSTFGYMKIHYLNYSHGKSHFGCKCDSLVRIVYALEDGMCTDKKKPNENGDERNVEMRKVFGEIYCFASATIQNEHIL